MTHTLCLLRHARPLIENGVCYGHLDVSAEVNANAQDAQSILDSMSARGVTPDMIYTSDLQRARQLTDAIHSQFLQTPLIVDQRLREMNFGCWEGHAWNDIPKAEYDSWIENFPDYQFGGLESCQQVLTRVIDFYCDMRATLEVNAQTSQRSGQVLCVTHAGVMRALRYYLETGNETISSASQWPATVAAFGCWETYLLE
jgi:alpha-ribazole phosphatase